MSSRSRLIPLPRLRRRRRNLTPRPSMFRSQLQCRQNLRRERPWPEAVSSPHIPINIPNPTQPPELQVGIVFVRGVEALMQFGDVQILKSQLMGKRRVLLKKTIYVNYAWSRDIGPRSVNLVGHAKLILGMGISAGKSTTLFFTWMRGKSVRVRAPPLYD